MINENQDWTLNMEASLHFTLTSMAENSLRLQLSGALTRTTLFKLTQAFNTALATPGASQLRVCTQEISDWDSIGLIQLKNCIKNAQQSISCHLEPLSTHVQSLWLMVSDAKYKQDIIPEKTQRQGIEKIGEKVVSWFKGLKLCIEYIGEIMLCLWSLIKHPKNLGFKKILDYMQEIGPNSLPLTFLIGILFGLIMAFQSAGLLRSFGAEIYVANLVSVALVKELGPLLMAIILTGRIASAYAAEIGAMQVNQEIDALRVMGLDPLPYLVLPRLIATALVAPFIALFMDLFGLLGCALVMVTEGFNRQVIVQQMFTFISMSDFVSSFIKSMIFGFLIAGIGCFHGLNSARNAAAVGASTTQTMVSCIAIVTTVDGIFTTLLFYLGI
jgi:phospholipid/cholesterol/gamma-HCH transport system permease protein